jgi:hypothetical protein
MALEDYLAMDGKRPSQFSDIMREDEFLVQTEIPPNCPQWRMDELISLFLAELNLQRQHGTFSGMRLGALMKSRRHEVK